jgi:hypothetical protein
MRLGRAMRTPQEKKKKVLFYSTNYMSDFPEKGKNDKTTPQLRLD